MIYLLESTIPENKSVFFALTHIYGVGISRASLLCRKLGFSMNLKTKDLTKEQLNQLIKLIEFLKLELASDLKKMRALDNKKLLSIKSYKGLRRKQGLPVRGQRTHTNSRTAKKIKY